MGPTKYNIPPDVIRKQFINQFAKAKDLSDTERDLLASGVVASEKTFMLDNKLENVIEIRLRQPPHDGWTD
jgi:hypothetical protein